MIQYLAKHRWTHASVRKAYFVILWSVGSPYKYVKRLESFNVDNENETGFF